jgi:hypothetical protein
MSQPPERPHGAMNPPGEYAGKYSQAMVIATSLIYGMRLRSASPPERWSLKSVSPLVSEAARKRDKF